MRARDSRARTTLSGRAVEVNRSSASFCKNAGTGDGGDCRRVSSRWLVLRRFDGPSLALAPGPENGEGVGEEAVEEQADADDDPAADHIQHVVVAGRGDR